MPIGRSREIAAPDGRVPRAALAAGSSGSLRVGGGGGKCAAGPRPPRYSTRSNLAPNMVSALARSAPSGNSKATTVPPPVSSARSWFASPS